VTVVATVCLALLLASAGLTLLYAFRNKALVERSIAVDTIVAFIVCGLLVSAAWERDGLDIDLALLIGVLGFMGTVTVARFIERRGS
jgi:multicomponent Na+:H+ antiporter subunit F